jgi:hypothetical protein
LTPFKGAAPSRPKNFAGEKIVMVLLGYFLVAVIAANAASAMVGLVLTNLLIGRFKKS